MPQVTRLSLESGIGPERADLNPFAGVEVKSEQLDLFAVSERSGATDEASALDSAAVAGCESRVGSERSRLTYRERREARAERLRGWAAKREASAGAVLKSHEVYRGDHAFNFQPGHIPERARVIAQSHRAFESLDKAERMSSRADEIDRQAEHAIYSDDEDACERLQERIAELSAKRDRMKAENAAFRKEHREQLKGKSVYERDCAIPHASFTLSNLSANINRQKKRLAALEAGR